VVTVAPIDVVVPTYRRPGLLVRCLAAIAAQDTPAARVIVVVRSGDDASARAAHDAGAVLGSLQVVEVQTTGVVAAMAAGVTATTSTVIAFTDDDARPRPDWIGRIAMHFEDPTVGGVGGRDVVPGQETPLTTSVGRFTRLGRLVGNHHLGMGPPRDVEVLKGVNMAFRVDALALPTLGMLRGDGAEVDFEMLTCAWSRAQGWRLIYDPALLVDHEGGPREGADQRAAPAPQAVFDAAYNSIVAATAVGGGVQRRRIIYPLIVGSTDRPGVVRGIVALGRGERAVLARLGPALAGRVAALRVLRSLLMAPQSNVVTAKSLRRQPRVRDVGGHP
jgi:Glycosyltransferase like family 2